MIQISQDLRDIISFYYGYDDAQSLLLEKACFYPSKLTVKEAFKCGIYICRTITYLREYPDAIPNNAEVLDELFKLEEHLDKILV